ncbi:MAG: hypothetical protein QX197_14450 [Methylococcaceae bacterium]
MSVLKSRLAKLESKQPENKNGYCVRTLAWFYDDTTPLQWVDDEHPSSLADFYGKIDDTPKGSSL